DGPASRVRLDGISQTESTMYDLGSAFNGTEAYWKNQVRVKRFIKKRCLYRPDIVDKIMFDNLTVSAILRNNMNPNEFFGISDALDRGLGIFVTGPHGVGKSHTLMNLVLKPTEMVRYYRYLPLYYTFRYAGTCSHRSKALYCMYCRVNIVTKKTA
ncbi:MAG: hypothetical protein ACREBR_00710, partial [bacterium]